MNRDDIASGARTHALRARLVPFISKRVDPQDVEDVVQTVFVRIHRGLTDLRDSDKLVAWGYQIARNVIVDHARRTAARRHEPLERARSAASSDNDDDTGARELALILGHFIAMLPDPYREALQLTELDGMTQAEAALRIGLSLSGMKSRVQRGRAQLRALLEACCHIELDTRGGIIDVEPHHAPAALPDCCARKPASSASIARLQSMTNKLETMNKQTVNTESTPDAATVGCCGGPAPSGSDACCVKDAAAKAVGESGCGCAPASEVKRRCC